VNGRKSGGVGKREAEEQVKGGSIKNRIKRKSSERGKK